jgi:hypothetical protein
VLDGGELNGMLFIHNGDKSGFALTLGPGK